MKKFAFVVVTLLLLAMVLAEDIDLQEVCFENVECQSLCESFGEDPLSCYCAENTCYLSDVVEEVPVAPPNTAISNSSASNGSVPVTPAPVSASSVELQSLQHRIAVMEEELSGVSQGLQALENVVAPLQQSLDQLSGSFDAIREALQILQEDVDGTEQKATTGLAVLQGDLDLTREDVDTLGASLAKEQLFRKTVMYIVFFVVAILVALVLIWYLRRKDAVDPGASAYINKQLAQGKKYDQLKVGLLAQGWSEQQIKNAYEKTTKANYAQYLKGKKKKAPIDRVKILSIGGVVLVLAIAVFFLYGGATGQAYWDYGGVVEFEENVPLDTTPQCFTPRIMVDGTCCLDLNDNGLCDDAERLAAQDLAALQSAPPCEHTASCLNGRQCIDGSCQFIADLYDTSACTIKCNAVRVLFSTFNHEVAGGNQEEYILPRGRGSYTGAGALEYIIERGPDYCQIDATQVPIPFKLIRKDSSGILSEHIISLKAGQESARLVHPSANLKGFTIRLDQVHQTCGTPVFQ